MTKGKFIVLEGQGFSGKSEQAPLLIEKLRAKGIDVIETQEPGGLPEALAIREELLRRKGDGTITPEEEVSLFYKSRGIFLHSLVVPALDVGTWVVSTRFSASTFVYQGYEGGIDISFIKSLDDEIVGQNQPDLYMLIDVDAKEIMRRMEKPGRMRHSYNPLDPQIVTNRQRYYKNIATENKNNNWVIIDGNASISEVEKKIWYGVKEKFSL